MEHITPAPPKQEPDLKTMCLFCLTQIDVYFDVKGRPFWSCPVCVTRTFGGRATLDSLKQRGWIWLEPRPLDAIKGWLTRLADSLGLPIEKPTEKDQSDVARP